MATCSQNFPGDAATASQIRALADEYRKAAIVLIPHGKAGKPLSRAPFRLIAIHAIELYLNAYLLEKNKSGCEIRSMRHSLRARVDAALEHGLVLRIKTAAHIRALEDCREYLISRYGPELISTATQLNRLIATLNEVAEKTDTTNQSTTVSDPR
jgi:hypothetical protein